MKGTPMFGVNMLFRIVAAGVLGILALGQVPAHAATDAARVVKYAQNDIVPVKAKLRFSTLIILPEKEEILDFTTGDKEFWIINGAHNLCYIHPAQASILSNLNLIPASGHVYSFLLTEISSDPNAEPDVKIFIESKEQSGIGVLSRKATFRPTDASELAKRWFKSHKSLGPSQNAAARLGSRSPRFSGAPRKWGRKIGRVSSERVPLRMPPSATFALLPSCS
jgi:Conjugal transfer protein